MPNRDLQWESWTITAVLHDVGEDTSEYAVYHGDKKVLRIEKAGRFNNLYRLHFSRRDSTVVAVNTQLTVGV